MSNYQPKEGNGALFKNDKGDNPARPDYRGDIMLGGVLYEVSGWIKPLPSDASQKFMSLSGKPKEQRNGQQRRPVKDKIGGNNGGARDDLSDVPF